MSACATRKINALRGLTLPEGSGRLARALHLGVDVAIDEIIVG